MALVKHPGSPGQPLGVDVAACTLLGEHAARDVAHEIVTLDRAHATSMEYGSMALIRSSQKRIEASSTHSFTRPSN